MFDPERLLGQLVTQGVRQSKRAPASTGKLGGLSLGMGAMGLAAAAFEHFQDSKNKQGSVPSSPPIQPSITEDTPTPPPLSAPSAPPPPPPPPGAQTKADPISPASDAENLIQVMIAAAAADGEIDKNEKSQILEHARQAGASDEDLLDLKSKLQTPLSIPELSNLFSEDLAPQAYLAALITIDPDTDAEKLWLTQFAQALNLSQEQIQSLHQQSGA